MVDKSKNINRKKFLLFSGAAFVGVYSFVKFPFSFFQSKLVSGSAKKDNANNIKIVINPNAVKRKVRGEQYG